MKKSTLTLLLAGFISSLFAQTNYSEITLPQLMKQKKQGRDLVIVDVRTDGEYYDTASHFKQQNIGRLKDIIHIPLQELQTNSDAIKKLEPFKNKEVYLICSHSYRSRVASKILLSNGFQHVFNVQGGMTEWFRRSKDLAPYKKDFYETGDVYKNISPAELSSALELFHDPLLVGINNIPEFFYDSLTIQYYRYFPGFKNVLYFYYSDSLKILGTIRQQQRPVVLYNMVNYGAAELAEWLVSKGITNVSYLVGNFNMFYEYLINERKTTALGPFIIENSRVRFTTPLAYCKEIGIRSGRQLIDLRHDSLYNKINTGAKHNFKHLKESANFYAARGEEVFMQLYPDKNKTYVMISQNGITGLGFANSLAEKGYKIGWIIGGLQRWEWYMNNVETFTCNDQLVR